MDRPDDLSRCLQSVFASTVWPDHVIVSDDSKLASPVRQVVDRYPVQYLKGPRAGRARNRTQCIEESRTTHVAFIDDDVVLPPEYLAAALRRLNALRPDVVLTGGELR